MPGIKSVLNSIKKRSSYLAVFLCNFRSISACAVSANCNYNLWSFDEVDKVCKLGAVKNVSKLSVASQEAIGSVSSYSLSGFYYFLVFES